MTVLNIGTQEPVDTVVADSFTVEACRHGYGQIGFWLEGSNRPFAVAYFSPDTIPAIVRMFIEALPVKGHA